MAAAAHWKRMSFLINDGAAFLFSAVDHSAKVVRPPPSCAAFVRVAVGEQHVALLSADGEVHIYSVTLAISGKDVVQLLGVVRDDYLHFTQIAAGAHFTDERLSPLNISEGAVDFLIAAWGNAIGILSDGILQIIHPQGEEICEWEVHRTIVQISMSNHVVLLGDDGTAHALGRNDAGQCDLPDLEDNVKFTEVAAGWKHSVLLRSDGTAAACGSNDWGQCNIPPLSEGVTYTHVAAGAKYAICNASDGNIVVCGLSANNQDIAFRAPGPGTAFAAAAPPSMLLQATLADLAMIFRTDLSLIRNYTEDDLA
ncbi:unnamed protein product [Prorocentrum cordatum]|uniref:Uncharacterized protein n=1 Tax=Prorocentrum cordatum TaxID=2364126 RepID=A0ABN9Y7S4_9DINO|nr:unnamed protein product [Polarella glacialis]